MVGSFLQFADVGSQASVTINAAVGCVSGDLLKKIKAKD